MGENVFAGDNRCVAVTGPHIATELGTGLAGTAAGGSDVGGDGVPAALPTFAAPGRNGDLEPDCGPTLPTGGWNVGNPQRGRRRACRRDGMNVFICEPAGEPEGKRHPSGPAP